MKRLAWLHPFLLAAFPIFSYYANNVGEATLAQVWLPLICALALAGIFYLFSRLLLGQWSTAALSTSAALVLIFGFGHVRKIPPPHNN